MRRQVSKLFRHIVRHWLFIIVQWWYVDEREQTEPAHIQVPLDEQLAVLRLRINYIEEDVGLRVRPKVVVNGVNSLTGLSLLLADLLEAVREVVG